MNNNKIKEDVLQELIDLMESKEVEGLKAKSPKFAKVEVEAESPEDLQDGLESAKDVVEKLPELPKVMGKEPEDDELDLERLKELYSKLK